MREIGSEFWDVPVNENDNGLFADNIQWYLSGRSALKAIIKETPHIKSVAMPGWCCDSMILPFIDAGISVKFYPVYFDGDFRQDLRFDCDALFIMDYFGYTGKAPDISGYPGTVIRDVTHSLFSKSYCDADYYFGSLRKWCGIRTGGFAFAQSGRRLIEAGGEDYGYTELRRKAMMLKDCYINGKPDDEGNPVTDKKYLDIFSEAEELLEKIDIAPASESDVELSGRTDAGFIRTRRRENAGILMSAFSDWLIFPEMSDSDCPMFVPVLVPGGKRDELRRHLIKNEIYCPVHWPVSEYHRLDETSSRIYPDELSLVCDQRYGKEDMLHIVNTIKSF